MATSADFAANEWLLLGDAPLAACAAVAVVDLGGGEREIEALFAGWQEAEALFGHNALMVELIRSLDPAKREQQERAPAQNSDDPASDAAAAALIDEALRLCAQAVELLELRAGPADVADYQAFVMHMAKQVAQASREGGFLGIGGALVSPAEHTVIREIANALKVWQPNI